MKIGAAGAGIAAVRTTRHCAVVVPNHIRHPGGPGMTSRKLYVALCATALTACGESAVQRDDANPTPAITKEAHHDVSPPLVLVPSAERIAPTEHEVKPIPRNFNRGPVRDQALQQVSGAALLLAPTL